MTVLIGWGGFHAGNFTLTSDEVRDYAWSKLQEVQTEEGYKIYQLADGDPTDKLGLRSLLNWLADHSGVTEEMAIRKLRYAAITSILRLPYGSTDEDAMLEEAETLYRASWSWDFVADNPVPDVKFEWNHEAIDRNLASFREWYERERQMLCGGSF